VAVFAFAFAFAMAGPGCTRSTGAHLLPTDGTGPLGTTSNPYDVIVVGSGAGGGTVASRLARMGKRVLLLEAGRDRGASNAYRVPAMHARATEDEELAWWFFVQHATDPAVDRTDSKFTEQGILYPRGSALGGSTAVNAMVTVLPTRSDWDRIAALTGDASFRADAMAAYEARVREWLPIEEPDPNLVLGDAKLTNVLAGASLAYAARDGASFQAVALPSAAALSALFDHDLNEALRAGETTGLYRLPLATQDGHRRGTRERARSTVDEGFPLTIETSAFVTKILWDRQGNDAPRAAGVEIARGDSLYSASLSPKAPPDARDQRFGRRVVLAAGTFNTPQILQLSGVGDPAALGALGVDVVAGAPGVGKNLQDRYEASVVAEFDDPIGVVAPCALGAAVDPCLDAWNAGRGVYKTSGFLATALLRSASDAPLADLQVFATPSDARGYFPGYSRAATTDPRRLSWLVLKAHTHNTDGEVRATSKDPFARPAIHFHSFDEKNPLGDPDLRAVVEGIKFARAAEIRFRSVAPETALRETWPGPAVATDDDLARFVRKEAWGHHACCTSKMGRADDGDAVVDARFRVKGTRDLFVVDASVFPEIPGTFIAMPIYMLAEKAADAIGADLALAEGP
jgi:choline dehydrogenase